MQNGLELKNLEVCLSTGDSRFRLVVEDFNLAAGAIVALTGESGSGKTLLLEMMGLLRRPLAGGRYTHVGADGRLTDLMRLWSRGPTGTALSKTRGALFGFVPQTGGLLPFLTVAENIALPQRLIGRIEPEWIDELLYRLGLRGHARLRPGQISVGQRQRVAIARALSHRPGFVIADEPTASLDPMRSDEVLHLLLETAQDTGCGVLVSSHEVDRLDRFRLPQLHLQVTTDGDTTVSHLEQGSSS